MIESDESRRLQLICFLALRLNSIHEDWEQGRACSPDAKDYVLQAVDVCDVKLDEEQVELKAESLWERMNEGMFRDFIGTARWLVAQLRSDLWTEGESRCVIVW